MKTKIAAVVALIAGIAMLATACGPECVDRFDCPQKPSQTASCQSNKCSYSATVQQTDAGS